MYVLKRDGRQERMMLDKITSRIANLCNGLNMKYVDPAEITVKVVSGLYSGVTTVELDNLAAETAATMTTKHPDYGILAARIAVSNLHKETNASFSETVEVMYDYVNPKTGLHSPLVSKALRDVVRANKERLDAAIVHDRDYEYNYFGFKTLERSYLLRLDGRVVERPQYLLMRVALGIHGEAVDEAVETYELKSQRWFTHASPTLYNSGTNRPQLSSCFLLTMASDSIEGIYDTLKQCAMISKCAGGIGIAVSCIRSTGTYIAGTNGTSNGLMPMLRVFNNTARYVDQGGNKRPGAFAVYLEPWHPDVFDFMDARKNTGKDEQRARDLFFGLWIPDLFMRRVEQDASWSLMDPHECPGLDTSFGEEFEKRYEAYEKAGKARRVLPARKVWMAMVESQVETGLPYICYKDHANRKSNHQHLGTLRTSNLCTEIMEYCAPDEVAVCNLASIALSRFVRRRSNAPAPADGEESALKLPSADDFEFDFEMLDRITRVVVRNLNKIIDVNHYPVVEARNSNMRHRPIGIGVQGLADCFALMRLPFESTAAQQLNIDIFETMYYAALDESVALAERDGSYSSYQGSPLSRGIIQPDMWNRPLNDKRHNWTALRARLARSGARNSLLMAPMPTASTAQILGNNESIEAYTSNVYTRRVLSGEFQIVNPHLMRDLHILGLWNADMKNLLVASGGSVQRIEAIPLEVRALYKTVWEISQKTIIKMAADRAPFVDQSQSLNIHMLDADTAKITSMHFYGWKLGLKTGLYYLRTKPAANAIQFTVDKTRLAQTQSTGTPNGDRKPKGLNNNTPLSAERAKFISSGLGNMSLEESREQSQPEQPLTDKTDQEKREAFEQAKLLCSLQNREACTMCSG